MPWIGSTRLDRVPMGTLQAWIAKRRLEGAAIGTIDHGLQVVRRIVILAASERVDDQGLTWLHAAPKIKLLPNTIQREPYPLSWEEQARLLRHLPSHLAGMALFAVSVGCAILLNR
ncbi:MAG: hypothetical protein R3D57_02610 [Hyphomicrobiaceae bacterium]